MTVTPRTHSLMGDVKYRLYTVDTSARGAIVSTS